MEGQYRQAGRAVTVRLPRAAAPAAAGRAAAGWRGVRGRLADRASWAMVVRSGARRLGAGESEGPRFASNPPSPSARAGFSRRAAPWPRRHQRPARPYRPSAHAQAGTRHVPACGPRRAGRLRAEAGMRRRRGSAGVSNAYALVGCATLPIAMAGVALLCAAVGATAASISRR